MNERQLFNRARFNNHYNILSNSKATIANIQYITANAQLLPFIQTTVHDARGHLLTLAHRIEDNDDKWHLSQCSIHLNHCHIRIREYTE